MLDPITIVSLVGTIIQFVDFGSKLISKSNEIYNDSDADGENVNIELATVDLTLLTEKLVSTSPAGDPGLEALCASCTEVANKLLDVLRKLHVSGKKKKWESFRKAFMSMWSEKDIKELERQLISLKQQVTLRITVDVRYVSFSCRITSKSLYGS
jgi:hypothetical protein